MSEHKNVKCSIWYCPESATKHAYGKAYCHNHYNKEEENGFPNADDTAPDYPL